jgi:hypothetical protein
LDKVYIVSGVKVGWKISLVMDNFSDSGQFRIGSDGRVCHRRDDETWVAKVLDGVELDKTIKWDGEGYMYIEEDEGDEMVGERKVSNEVQETTKRWGKEKGEGKFKREKKIPLKKKKKYPTKPKPKNSWHKRLSKVAQLLDMEDNGSHTEEKAVQDWGNFWDEKLLEEEREEEKYWESWAKDVKDFSGHYAVISLKILVNPDGVSVHDIDGGGVKRDNCYDPYNEGRDGRYAMKEWEKLPSVVGGCVQERDTYVQPGFSFRKYNFFTYWDERNQLYIWESMNSHNWNCGGWRKHFDYYPDVEMIEDVFCLDEQYLPWKELNTLSRWINGIEWETIWSRMDEIRTGVMCGREHEYIGGDGFMNRSREPNYYPKTQIPRMIFH